jgi:protein-tyrosine phosphatase
VIDTHSHLLPGVDDGCKTVEESLVCARALVAAGYTRAFCTPHVWPSLPGNSVKRIPELVAELQEQYDAAGVALKLSAGGEINLRKDITNVAADAIVTYSMRRTHVLVDLWADRLPPHFEPAVRWLQSLGLWVILAHPERMRAVQEEPELADYFAELGVLLQGNLQCFHDALGSPTRRTADRFLKEGRYWMLGSDTHNPGGLPDRIAGLARVRSMVDGETFERLTEGNPATLL